MKTSLCRCSKTNETHRKNHTLDRSTSHTRRHERSVSLSAGDALAANGIELPPIQDSASVQHALSIVINAVAAGTLDTTRAKVLLYGLQIASTNARRISTSPKAEAIVRNVEATGNNRSHGEHVEESFEVVHHVRETDQTATKDDKTATNNNNVETEETTNDTSKLGQEIPARAPAFSIPPLSAYEIEARSRMTALRRLRDERINSAFTKSKCISRPFGDE